MERIKAQRSLEPAQYLAMPDFRNQYPADLVLEMDFGRPFEKAMAPMKKRHPFWKIIAENALLSGIWRSRLTRKCL